MIEKKNWPIQEARKILKTIWDSSWLRGRCWGIKKDFPNNPVGGSNITLMDGDTMITISEKKDGMLILHEFARVDKTKFGDKIMKELGDAGMQCARVNQTHILSRVEGLPKTDHLWQCSICNDRFGFDTEGSECPDVPSDKIKQEVEQHCLNSPICVGANIYIFRLRGGVFEKDEDSTNAFNQPK